MRVLVYILISMALSLATGYAQEDSTVTSDKQEEGSGLSISFDGDLSFSGNENTYFSTSDSDDTYKVRAKFNAEKTAKIRAYLLEEFGKKQLKVSGTKQQWRVAVDGITSYEIKIDEGNLRIFVDKELASSSTLSKMKAITKNIKAHTSGKSREQREAEKAKRDKSRLDREAAQKIREAERLKREAERLEREAARLEKEANVKRNK